MHRSTQKKAIFSSASMHRSTQKAFSLVLQCGHAQVYTEGIFSSASMWSCTGLHRKRRFSLVLQCIGLHRRHFLECFNVVMHRSTQKAFSPVLQCGHAQVYAEAILSSASMWSGLHSGWLYIMLQCGHAQVYTRTQFSPVLYDGGAQVYTGSDNSTSFLYHEALGVHGKCPFFNMGCTGQHTRGPYLTKIWPICVKTL